MRISKSLVFLFGWIRFGLLAGNGSWERKPLEFASSFLLRKTFDTSTVFRHDFDMVEPESAQETN